MSFAIGRDPVLDVNQAQRSKSCAWRRNTFLCSLTFLIVMAFVKWPDLVDRPVSRWISAQVGRSESVDRMFFAFDIYFTFSGVILMALIWSCWSGLDDDERRARLLIGVIVAFGAGVFSRLLQHQLSSHMRPLYDPAVSFHIPGGFSITPLNTWDSFPSDHVAVFAGLVVVLFTVQSKLAIPAALWTTLVESSRLYMGAHFLSDVVGGAALAATCVWAVQSGPFIALGGRILDIQRRARPLFYGVAFFISFQVATLFMEIRGLTGGFSLLHSLH